ncbi:hypothetical protein HELRODRAFT_165594 [Helobdella robusta]|uniref:EGF-like domain-containing protein n=1 Tax=Helobdella robusta TaxID=6412 RepID=T1EX19_HELRO|nr:hypothetical protein HELRODRAFT_165594 [Helobdella robusta]ESN91541.1 hypothetical protein HELRODRAFT_165594 [Helobdella robusta]
MGNLLSRKNFIAGMYFMHTKRTRKGEKGRRYTSRLNAPFNRITFLPITIIVCRDNNVNNNNNTDNTNNNTNNNKIDNNYGDITKSNNINVNNNNLKNKNDMSVEINVISNSDISKNINEGISNINHNIIDKINTSSNSNNNNKSIQSGNLILLATEHFLLQHVHPRSRLIDMAEVEQNGSDVSVVFPTSTDKSASDDDGAEIYIVKAETFATEIYHVGSYRAVKKSGVNGSRDFNMTSAIAQQVSALMQDKHFTNNNNNNNTNNDDDDAINMNNNNIKSINNNINNNDNDIINISNSNNKNISNTKNNNDNDYVTNNNNNNLQTNIKDDINYINKTSQPDILSYKNINSNATSDLNAGDNNGVKINVNNNNNNNLNDNNNRDYNNLVNNNNNNNNNKVAINIREYIRRIFHSGYNNNNNINNINNNNKHNNNIVSDNLNNNIIIDNNADKNITNKNNNNNIIIISNNIINNKNGNNNISSNNNNININITNSNYNDINRASINNTNNNDQMTISKNKLVKQSYIEADPTFIIHPVKQTHINSNNYTTNNTNNSNYTLDNNNNNINNNTVDIIVNNHQDINTDFAINTFYTYNHTNNSIDNNMINNNIYNNNTDNNNTNITNNNINNNYSEIAGSGMHENKVVNKVAILDSLKLPPTLSPASSSTSSSSPLSSSSSSSSQLSSPSSSLPPLQQIVEENQLQSGPCDVACPEEDCSDWSVCRNGGKCNDVTGYDSGAIVRKHWCKCQSGFQGTDCAKKVVAGY